MVYITDYRCIIVQEHNFYAITETLCRVELQLLYSAVCPCARSERRSSGVVYLIRRYAYTH